MPKQVDMLISNSAVILYWFKMRGACVAELVERLTLDFGSGHDLTVHGFEPRLGLQADSVELAWDSVSLLSLPLLHSFSLKINK